MTSTPTRTGVDETSAVLERARLMEHRVRALVQARRAGDPAPDDPFRGLYLDDAALDRLLGESAEVPSWQEFPRDGQEGRLGALARTFGLGELDVDLLMVALLPELDPRTEQLFGYLNDDVTRRRPSAAVALALCDQSLGSAAARARLVSGPLLRHRLLHVDDVDRPFPGRSLRVPDRVVAHLLGDDAVDPLLVGVVVVPTTPTWGDSERLAEALSGGLRLAYLREAATGSAVALTSTAARAAQRPVIAVDLRTLAGADAPRLWPLVVREALLREAVLCAGPVEALPAPALLLDSIDDAELSVVLWGTTTWDPRWADGPALQVAVPASTVAERDALWLQALDVADVDLAQATRQFRMRPEQVVRAADSARVAAAAGGRPIDVDIVRAAARAENSTALDSLARRIEPGVGWDDLVLAPGALSGLREVSLRARHRELVLGTWRMRPGGGRGHGIAALFAGDSGTGKTMSAEVVAADLGLDLYVVDLATVVDKYVGETEKNLERIFTAASGVNAVLLFDEADAIFGKRSEVRDAHDKYANVESAYLLQRMETFDGLAILATNLRSNIDEAFTRRLDVMVDFPLPDPEHRLLLWDRSLGRTIPRAADLDLDYCARSFELAGGAIRSAAVTAAYLAAEHGDGLTMTHVVRAVQREYRKLGRLCLPGEFGAYWSLIES